MLLSLPFVNYYPIHILRISHRTIEEVKNQIEIDDVLSDYLTLKKKGANYWACCPFHNEKTPSFSITPSKGIYKCFGCGVAGDAINFVMEIEGISFEEAIRLLAKKYGITIVEETKTDKEAEEIKHKDSLIVAMQYARDEFHKNLTENTEGKTIGLSYLNERGFADDLIQKFGLGYSLEKWTGLTDIAVKKGFKKNTLEEAGLLIRREGKEYDRFRGRVMFPIHNTSGKVIAFGARTLKKDDKQAKYLNSPETLLYNKSKILYGIFQAKAAIRKDEKCYLVEGYTDVISMHGSGVKNVVASSGTSLTPEQVGLIKRYTDNITVLFDGDKAGVKASLRGMDIILEAGLNVKIVSFPEGEDPDSFSQKLGENRFQRFLSDEEQDFISFKVSLFSEELNKGPMEKVKVIKDIMLTISKIPDELKRAIYIKECSKLLGISESSLLSEEQDLLAKKQEFERKQYVQKQQKINPTPSSTPQEEKPVSPALTNNNSGLAQNIQQSVAFDKILMIQERESIRLLINYGFNDIDEESKLHVYLLEELEDIEFISPKYKSVLEYYKRELSKGKSLDGKSLINNAEEEIKEILLELLGNRYELSENWFLKHDIAVQNEEENLKESVFTSVLRLKLRVINKLVDENMIELKSMGDDMQKILAQMEVIKALKQTEKEIASYLGIVVNR